MLFQNDAGHGRDEDGADRDGGVRAEHSSGPRVAEHPDAAEGPAELPAPRSRRALALTVTF